MSQHPFIMRLVCTSKDPDYLYFYMEYLHLGLRDVMNEFKNLDSDQTRFYAGCFCMIAEHLQENNIVHRNFHPDSFMIDEYGYPKLRNF